jgi:release factor glutamine methyltransferase
MTQPASWTPLALVRWTAEYFARHGIATPRLDAELLLAHVLGARRIDLYLRFEEAIGETERARYRELVRQRGEQRIPVAYLTGTREFWSLPLEVSDRTLIPRPETETLVRAVVDLAPERFADVGTGCGAIAAAVALELPGATGVATDVSPDALAVAARNFERLGVAARVEVREGSGLSVLPGGLDVIAANPPYVRSGEIEGLPAELHHEPRLALDGGEDGLLVTAELIQQAPAKLRPGGSLALEVGRGQAPAVERAMRDAGAADVRIHKDLAGIERVVVGTFPAASGA